MVCVAVDISVVKGCTLNSFSFILQSDEVSFLQYYMFFVLPNDVLYFEGKICSRLVQPRRKSKTMKHLLQLVREKMKTPPESIK